MGLFGSSAASTAAPSAPQRTGSAMDDLLGGDSGTPPTAASSSSGPAAHHAYQKNGLAVTIQVQRSAQQILALARFRNESPFDRLTGVGLQAAVPKSQKLALHTISKAELEGGEEATQQMRITSTGGGALPPRLRLRLKISYTKDGEAPLTEQVDWSEPA